MSSTDLPTHGRSLSRHWYDPTELSKYFGYGEETLTAIQRKELERKWRRSTLYVKSLDENMMFYPIPDETVFAVKSLLVPKDDDKYLEVFVDIVPAEDGYKSWEFRRADPPSLKSSDNTKTEMTKNPDGVDWEDAPWKHQTKAWLANFSSKYFPGLLSDSHEPLLTLCLYRTPEVEKQVSEWTFFTTHSKSGEFRLLHIGTFLVSCKWMAGLAMYEETNGIHRGIYRLFLSDGEIKALSSGSRSFRPKPVEVIGPRQDSDVMIRDREIHEYPSWTTLPIVNLPASAEKDKDFKRYFLDESAALEYRSIDRNTHGNHIRKSKLAQMIWNHAYFKDPKDTTRTAFLAFPDGVSFAVLDVNEKDDIYEVSIRPLEGDKDDLSLTGQGPVSSMDFMFYLYNRYGVSNYASNRVFFPKSNRNIRKLAKNSVIKSNGWVAEFHLLSSSSLLVTGTGNLYPSFSVFRKKSNTVDSD